MGAGLVVTRGHGYRQLMLAWVSMSFGDGLRMAALPLYTAITTGNALSVSIVAAADVLPWLVLALPAGAVSDRVRPRTMVRLATIIRVAIGMGLVAFMCTGTASVPILAAAGFLLTGAEVFADNGAQRLLVEVAERADLRSANSHFLTAETVGLQFAGPLVVMVVFLWSPVACFVVYTAVMALGAAMISRLPAGQAPPRGSRRLFGEMAQGFRFILRRPELTTIAGTVTVVAVLTSAVNTLAPLYCLWRWQLTPSMFPLLLLCASLGVVLAARLAVPGGRRFGDGTVMITGLLTLGCGFAAFGLAARMWAACLAYVAMGAGAGAWNVLSSTRRQRLTPDHLLGRVTSVNRLMAYCLMPVGAAAAGPLSTITSLSTVLIGSAVLLFATVVVIAARLRALDS